MSAAAGEGLDHRAFARSPPQATRNELTARRDGPGLARLAVHAGTILAPGAWIAMRGPGWPLPMLYAGIAAAAAAGSSAPPALRLGPMLPGRPVLRLHLLAEHGRAPFVADMFENARARVTARAGRGLAWNTPCHAEHHAMPTVPFQALPRLHALSRPHLKTAERGCVRFNLTYLRAPVR
ncbi:MAG: fatty acid desaturase [Pseudomonadota bacterium]